MTSPARLIFEDGTEYLGRFFTSSSSDTFGEIVFNTAMTGYQEVLTDPSYTHQCVLMTYPMIGSYGINATDHESQQVHLNALLCKEYIAHPSNFQSTQSLASFLDQYNRVGVEGLDTRAITLHIRTHGSQRVMITSNMNLGVSSAQALIKNQPLIKGLNLAQTLSPSTFDSVLSSPPAYTVAVLDCGVKFNILRRLQERGCRTVILGLDDAQQQLENGQFDGLLISNGPGDPEPVQTAIQLIQSQLGQRPIFGICLGHQLIAHALGGQTYKMPFGHHGANHPVQHIKTGRVEITSQNHGFCVDMGALTDQVVETHVNLYDGTNEGFRHRDYPLFSVQYHPESAPGPCDSEYLFDDFLAMMTPPTHHG